MIDKLLSHSDAVRYVAVYRNGNLDSKARRGTANASDSQSDVYEELLVNPTLLTLAGQRGNIDCGGLNYVLIRYGNFFQLVIPQEEGHVSICLESESEVMTLLPGLLQIVMDQ